jgi:hypothetical protein
MAQEIQIRFFAYKQKNRGKPFFNKLKVTAEWWSILNIRDQNATHKTLMAISRGL